MKKKIDDNFKKDLYHYCAQFSGLSSWKGVECRRLADIYVAFVRKYGKHDQIGDVAFSKREENIFDIDLDEDIEGQEIPDVLPEDVEDEKVDGISKREEDIFDITADENIEEVDEISKREEDIFDINTDEDIEEVDDISKREEDTVLNIGLDEDIEGQEIPDVLPEDVEGDEVEDIDAYLGEAEE